MKKFSTNTTVCKKAVYKARCQLEYVRPPLELTEKDVLLIKKNHKSGMFLSKQKLEYPNQYEVIHFKEFPNSLIRLHKTNQFDV